MGFLSTGFKSFDTKTQGLETKSTYLIVGSKDSGKEMFVYKLVSSLLANKADVVYVLTRKSSTDLVTDINKTGFNLGQYLGESFKVLDDFSRTISPTMVDNAFTKVLNGPVDLTGLNVAVSSVSNEFLRNGGEVVDVFDSLSQLLIYNNSPTLFRFLQFVCGKSKLSGVTSIFLLDEEMHTPEINETIRSLIDVVISLKLENGKRYFTMSGGQKEVLDWSLLE